MFAEHCRSEGRARRVAARVKEIGKPRSQRQVRGKARTAAPTDLIFSERSNTFVPTSSTSFLPTKRERPLLNLVADSVILPLVSVFAAVFAAMFCVCYTLGHCGCSIVVLKQCLDLLFPPYDSVLG